MAMSVDGLVSGLNTTDMVNQLMQVEAMPQTALKNKVTAQNKAVTAYQDINTKLAALTTAAKALGTTDSWNAVKASSTSDAAIITTSAAATAGSLTFTVDDVATSHTTTYLDQTKWVSALTDPVTSGPSLSLVDKDGNPVVVTPADTSLQAVVKAINETPNLAYKASTVQPVPGKFTLQLASTASGFDGRFDETLLAGSGLDLGAVTVTSAGQNAKITVGTTSPYSIESATNTFTDVVAGVNIAITKESATPVTVSMVADKAGIADKAQALVDAANAVLNQIKTATANKSGTTAGGPLAGDSTLRSLSQEIISAVATGAGAVGSLATVGISVERGGTLKFDKEKFQAAHATDPTGTQKFFDSYDPVPHVNAKAADFDPGWDLANGIARRFETIGLKATEGINLPTDPTGTSREGIVGGLIKRRNDSIAQLNDQVEAWDTRLETRRATLQRQYSALEVALGKLKEQQSWLSGQLAGLS
jgi:flagellar hook-associated protein 2